MYKLIFVLLFVVGAVSLNAQEQTSSLSIDQIMEGDAFVGTPPCFSHWSRDSKSFFFYANNDNTGLDSLYQYNVGKRTISLVKQKSATHFVYSSDKKHYLFVEHGDVWLAQKGEVLQITNSVEVESDPHFRSDGTSILFQRDNNLLGWNRTSGQVTQYTNFISGKKSNGADNFDKQDQWLTKDQMEMMEVLTQRAETRSAKMNEALRCVPERPLPIYLDNKRVSNIRRSTDGNIFTYQLYAPEKDKPTLVPNYVTESSYTENISARANVGTGYGTMSVGCYHVEKDTAVVFSVNQLAGLYDNPAYFVEYGRDLNADEPRAVDVHSVKWSRDGKHAVAFVSAKDNKDVWIVRLNTETFECEQLDRQHDDAWIAGPGIERTLFWLYDNKTIVFQSEESGYSHLYSYNIESNVKKALTQGEFEIYNPALSKNGGKIYFESNQEDSGIRNAYCLSLKSGLITKVTDKPGRTTFHLSPNEKLYVSVYSESNKPLELYVALMGKEPQQITHSTTKEFDTYEWRKPQIVEIPARDGEKAKARLYKPKTSNGKAVLFVHGAGYLQNAHQWWSSYFREYMFHNFLVDLGYTVLDIDYRGSAGYGRDWRIGIYRHMGGKDLTDQVDGANYLVKELGIEKEKIGIYGGSYGGFITLMALLNTDTFAAGAALRSVTDWSHYNHGYTSNILNTPTLDPKAFKRSSPIYFAEGLNEPLLMCHGMVDDNVHFQDVVRLSQRFIELRKENWEMAIFPVEPHGFREATSWADEYKRIYKLFKENL